MSQSYNKNYTSNNFLVNNRYRQSQNDLFSHCKIVLLDKFSSIFSILTLIISKHQKHLISHRPIKQQFFSSQKTPINSPQFPFFNFQLFISGSNQSLYKYIKMSSTPTSQISLIKVNSNAPKCWVFYEGDEKLEKYELSVDDSTTISALINMAMNLVKGQNLTIDFSSKDCLFELYASKKNGRKLSDLPSLQEKQTVVKTGIKFFVLQNSGKKAKPKRVSTVSTKSIQSEMKETSIKSSEVKATKNVGCFCF